MRRRLVRQRQRPRRFFVGGVAVSAALPRLGFNFAKSVRQGKRFEIEVDGEPTPSQLAEVEKAAEKLLANPVIETFTVRVEK